MTEVVDFIVIPHERVPVLIGKNGEVKKRLERECGVKIRIASEFGEVSVVRSTETDFIKAIQALDIIKAIGRGFSPDKAFKLLEPLNILDIVDLSEHVSDRSLERVRARIIGREGKARKYFSRLTKTNIAVHGKTVSFIGDAEAVNIAKQAVLKIVRGLPHRIVFKYVEAHRR